jgi:ABC-type sugar transport system permease subunit
MQSDADTFIAEQRARVVKLEQSTLDKIDKRVETIVAKIRELQSCGLLVLASIPAIDTACFSVPDSNVSNLPIETLSPEACNNSDVLSADDSYDLDDSSCEMPDLASFQPATVSACDVTALELDELDESCASSTFVDSCDDDALSVECDTSHCSTPASVVVVDPTIVLSCLHALLSLQHQPLFATNLYRKLLTFFPSPKLAAFATLFAFLVSVLMVVLFVPALFIALLVPRNWKKRLKPFWRYIYLVRDVVPRGAY